MELSPMMIICVFAMWERFQLYDFSPYANDITNVLIIVPNYERNLITTEMSSFEILLFLILFSITDVLRYRSIIILTLAMTAIMDFTIFTGLDNYWTIEMYYAMRATNYATVIANSAYLYSITRDKSNYQKITAYVHASGLVGTSMGYSWTQIYFHTLRGHSNVIPILIRLTMAIVTFTLFYSLPPVDANPSNNADNEFQPEQQINPPSNAIHKIQNMLEAGISHIWYNLMTAYSNLNVLKWSVWYILTSFLVTQVEDDSVRIPMFNDTESFEILKSISAMWYFMYFLISAALIIFCSFRPSQWETRGDWVLSLVSFVLAILTLIRFFHLPQFILIIISIISIMIIDVFLTMSLWEIVAIIPRNSYALIMGFNIFVIQVVKIAIWKISENKKYMIIYGMIYLGMGVVFGILEKRRRRPPSAQNIPFLEEEHEPVV